MLTAYEEIQDILVDNVWHTITSLTLITLSYRLANFAFCLFYFYLYIQSRFIVLRDLRTIQFSYKIFGLYTKFGYNNKPEKGTK